MITTAVPLTSNLNYSLTKKRLTMMIRTTSKLKTWTARLAVIPVLAAMLFLFSMKSISEVPKFKPTALGNLPKMEDGPDKETFFKGATIWIENKDGSLTLQWLRYLNNVFLTFDTSFKIPVPFLHRP